MRRNTANPYGYTVEAEMRAAVWTRLNGEAMVPATVTASYFSRVTRGFAFDAALPADGFDDGRLFWAWDVFQGRAVPLLVIVRHFDSLGEANAAMNTILKIDHDNVRRMVCHAEPSRDSSGNSKPFVWMSATELPPRQHSVATYAPEKADDKEWAGAILKGVRAGLEYLREANLTAVLSPDTVFLRSGKPEKPYLTRLISLGPNPPPIEVELRELTAKIAEAAGLQVSYTQCINALDADGDAFGDAGGMFDDDLGTPLIFEQVGNCPIVLRERCCVCRQLVKSAGFHMRGADCDLPVRHFECESCVNKRVEEMLKAGNYDLDSIPCHVANCRGKFDFDDYGAVLHASVLREWNKLARQRALKEVEEDVNKRLAEMREKR
mmetsp:Transcript_23588/g.73075  ORF Transcript_23588/g.73075 Transcript_23588/m.73075 type:complete len:379 (-) Transcript_23588:83-1219(-)|eukprot:CAMPEP_0174828788 /NCGR_PEP_ID=MMETSP1114-20130205/1538_1 /TAXON_ID=312471 /ORGANISM="Neobodo designis, Strain CCAP 1951/1" /LENGTH=378 /DNA_ID=CAMNT_0016062513 /DNA_START=92 /DNA_END=1228 /DNA_ORIENTATION=+